MEIEMEIETKTMRAKILKLDSLFLGAALASFCLAAGCTGVSADTSDSTSNTEQSELTGGPPQSPSMKAFSMPNQTRKPRTSAQIAAAINSGFDYPATLVGTSGNTTIYYDTMTQRLAAQDCRWPSSC
jgi:hypothetical protein